MSCASDRNSARASPAPAAKHAPFRWTAPILLEPGPSSSTSLLSLVTSATSSEKLSRALGGRRTIAIQTDTIVKRTHGPRPYSASGEILRKIMLFEINRGRRVSQEISIQCSAVSRPICAKANDGKWWGVGCTCTEGQSERAKAWSYVGLDPNRWRI